MPNAAELGRQAFARRAWTDAYRLLSAHASLPAEDFERLAVAAHLVGEDADSDRAWQQAHLAFAHAGEIDRAARCAFWLGFALLLRGDGARAGGWFGRAERLVDNAAEPGVTRGYLLVPVYMQALYGGDPSTAATLARRILDAATRAPDADLHALGLLCCGESQIVNGDTGGGMRLFDEAMVAVSTGEVSPIPAGIVYCAVIDACMQALDIRRAATWSDALLGWCDANPDVVPYRGVCLVHRAQVLQARGAWPDALAEAERAERMLARVSHPALGLAVYQQGELRRLRGEFAAAADRYRAASGHGHDPAPGLALLRLAQGDVKSAAAAIRRLVEESRGRLGRPSILVAAVEILLTAGAIDEASAASDELSAGAAAADAPLLLRARAYDACGAVRLAIGDAPAALVALREAGVAWRALAMPYELARSRVKLAQACLAVDDGEAAVLEADAARSVFARLDAGPDLDALDTRRNPAALTDRECEVLRLVAAGLTNRQVGAELVISEHTVARHLQNIFTKTGRSSRTAVTAYAYEHGLV